MVRLPAPRDCHAYALYIQSDQPHLEPRSIDAEEELIVGARSVFILIEERV